MKIELFALCDFAADYGGKFNIIGIFDTLNSPQVPFAHDRWSLAVKIRFEKIEEGRKSVRISISDMDGRNLTPGMEIPFVANVPDDLPSATFNLMVAIDGIRFDQFGEHSVDLAIDGRHEASIPLFIRRIPG